MGILSKTGVAASIADFSVKKLFSDLLANATIAAAGSSQATGTLLTAHTNLVTAADGTKAVVLPPARSEMSVRVVNTVSTADLPVYPAVNDNINSAADDAAFTLPGGQDAFFDCDIDGHWYVRVGNGASSAELDFLNGAADTNAVAAKAAILGTGGALTLGGALTATTSIGIGAAVLTEAELEMLDTLTGGTATASKAAVLGTNKELDEFHTAALYLGAGAGTLVDSTALEINRATDLSARLVAAGATKAVTLAAHDGRTVLLDTAGGSVCTLPLATGTGARLRFVVTVRPSGASHVIKVGNASDFIAGQINLLDLDSNAVTAYQGDGAADDTITINNTTTGGAIGDSVELEDTLLNVWTVLRGALTVPVGSNVADPFSATV